MAASEVAVSLALVRLHDLLSKSEDIIISKKLTNQISRSIRNLQEILKTTKHAELKDDHDRETPGGEEQLLLLAGGADKIAEHLVESFRDQMSKSQKGCLAALVPVFSVMNRVCARRKMARKFMMKVGSMYGEFASSWPAPKEGLPDNEKASSSSSSKRNRENTRRRVASDIVGREKYVNELLDWLVYRNDSNLLVISVVGEHACGKTALVRSVFSRPEIKHHFDRRAWVHVPNHGSGSDWIKNLLVDILKQTPLRDHPKNLENKQEEQLFEIFHKSLMELRYLIVLDDLGEASLINDILVPFVDSMKASRVIVTTPNAETQKFADPWTPALQLGPDLTDSECKELLLVSITGGGNSLDHDLESKMPILKERILSKCNGSPPAISLLGGLLSVAGSNCEALIDRLGDRPTLNDIMSLSFDKLPYMMKPCVLYMALFPKESEVPTRKLFRRWAAEGFLAEAADRSVRMLSAEDCFHELESRNLICVVRRKLDGSARSCCVPAFLHEFFCQKAKEFGLLEIQYSNSVLEDDSKAMGLNAKQSVQNQQKFQCLQSFSSFNTRNLGTQPRGIKVLFKSSNLDFPLVMLRVLDLEGVYKPVLTLTFGNELLNLRYLGLRWTVLDSIPKSVGNLLFLETLDLKHTNINKVTSTIWNAKNLQHLYLSEASFDKSIQFPSSPNTKLETLWGLFVETAECPMISVLEKQRNLKKLGVTCCPGAVNVVSELIWKLSSLQSLRLRSRDLFGQPANLHLSGNMVKAKSLSNLYLVGSLQPLRDPLPVLPKNLKSLTLSMSKLECDVMLYLKDLKELIVLRLLARSYTGRSLVFSKEALPKLRILKLWMLEQLEKLVVEERAMCSLEELTIRQCKNLEKVEGLHRINSLKIVSITGDDSKVKPVKVPQHTLVKPKELDRKNKSASKR